MTRVDVACEIVGYLLIIVTSLHWQIFFLNNFCCCWVNITTHMGCNRIDWWKGCLESRAACLLMLRDFVRNCWCSGYQTSNHGNVNWKSKVMVVNWQFHNKGGYKITILISYWTWGCVTVCWLWSSITSCPAPGEKATGCGLFLHWLGLFVFASWRLSRAASSGLFLWF